VSIPAVNVDTTAFTRGTPELEEWSALVSAPVVRADAERVLREVQNLA
jgi:hypothetical protein